MSSIDELHVFLGRDCLPTELGGLLQYDHNAWYHRCKVSSCCQCLLFMLMWSSAMYSLLFSETVSSLVAYFLLGHPLYYHIRASLHLALYYIMSYIMFIDEHMCAINMVSMLHIRQVSPKPLSLKVISTQHSTFRKGGQFFAFVFMRNITLTIF